MTYEEFTKEHRTGSAASFSDWWATEQPDGDRHYDYALAAWDAATLAERERCAKVAEHLGELNKHDRPNEWQEGFRAACKQIPITIRTG